MNSIARRDVEAAGRVALRGALRVDGGPTLSAVAGAQNAPQVGGVNKIGVTFGDGDAKRLRAPIRTEAAADPRIVYVRRRHGGFFTNEAPGESAIGTFRDAEGGLELSRAKQIKERNV